MDVTLMRSPESLDRELVALYRGWERVESTAPSGLSIIDFDLAPPGQPTELANRADVERLLAELRGELAAGLGDDDILTARLDASLMLLRVIRGDAVPFHDYLHAILLIDPVVFDDDTLAGQRAVVEERLHGFGLDFTAAAFPAFRKKFEIRNFVQLRTDFEAHKRKWLPVLRNIIDVPVERYTITESFALEDAYWKNWISGNLSQHQIELKINVHSRQQWYEGAVENLVIHEYCGHALQMIAWHRRIEQRRIPRFAGVLTVHFPDQFVIEGIAESLAFFPPIQSQLSDHAALIRDHYFYTLLVMNNAHVIANTRSVEEALAYASARLPFSDLDRLRADVTARRENLVLRAYQYVYGISKYEFVGAFKRLNYERAAALIENVYAGPLTPQDFRRYAGKNNGG